MKTPLSFYLAAAVAGTLGTFACSDDGGKNPRDVTAAGGSAGQTQVGNAGSSSGGQGGSSQGTSGSGGGSSSGVTTGAALEITQGNPTANGASALVVDSAGNTGLDGLAQVIKSPLGTTVTSGLKDGALCMNGATVVVPNMDYTNYWGAEIDLDVKLVASGAAPAPVADAGADAGGDAGAQPERIPTGWNASAANVVGFSFKIDGPTIPAAFRFKALPYGANSSTTTYCNQVVAVAGATINIRFDQITFECWNPGGAGALTMPYPPDNPDGKLLRTISWQVPADINIPFPFDFCISDIKPILGN
jgi:hypothetical protein